MADRNILIVAAHPDDEVLGCGGTIAKHSTSNDNVDVLFMADGVASRIIHDDKDFQSRNTASQKACEMLGVRQVYELQLPDNGMDTIPFLDIVQKLEKVIDITKPEIIYTHHIGDLNIDHQITHKAVMTACRPQPFFCVRCIYSFEVLSSTEWQATGVYPFTPNVFVDISDFIDLKMSAMEAYSMEMRPEPHSRSINNSKNLAGFRGNSVGLQYAEAFMLIRDIR